MGPGAGLAGGMLFGIAFALAVWRFIPTGPGAASPSPSHLLTCPSAIGPVYTAEATPLATSPGGIPIATLIAATPLHVLSLQGAAMQVGMDLYRSPDSPTIVYQDAATLSRAGVLTSPDAARLTGTATVVGSSWQRVHLAGWVQREATTANLDSLWSQASSLYEQRCGTCHTAHNAGEFTGRQWVSQFRAMVPRTSLTAGQADLVLKWLQAHAASQ
jgi:mono/diheme cytochrome c family protein